MNAAEIITILLAAGINIFGFFMPARWLTAAFIASVIATSYIQLAVGMGPLNLRLCQMVLPVMVLQLIRSGVFGSVSSSGFRLVLAGLLFWLALAFFTTLHMLDTDRNTVESMGHVALVGLNMFHALVIYALIMSGRNLRTPITVLMVSVVACNLILLIAGSDYVQQRVDLSSFFSISSEDAPVLVNGMAMSGKSSRFVVGMNAGNISAAALIILVCMSFTGERKWRIAFIPAALITTVGMVVGFSRQALVGFAAVCVLLGFYLLWMRRVRLVAGAVSLLVALSASFWALGEWSATAPYWQAFMGRAAQLFDSGTYSSGTAGSRLQIWSGMLDDIAANPLIGSGQDAYLAHVSSFIKSHNYPLEVWHASGMFGFIAYAGLHAAVLWGAFRLVCSRRMPEQDRWALLGVSLAFIVLFLSSFTNLITWSQTYWMLLGMVAAACRLMSMEQSEVALQPAAEPDEATAWHWAEGSFQ